MSRVGFSLMSFAFKVRDIIIPRKDVLKEVRIEPGFYVLDYGCGPGSYNAPLIELVGTSGVIYALDIHPSAIKKVRKIAAQRAVSNIKTIESDCDTGLPDNHLDVVLLYDTFHNLCRPEDVLRELQRVLKPGGILSFSDHHMDEQDILAKVTETGLFTLSAKVKKTYTDLQKSGDDGHTNAKK